MGNREDKIRAAIAAGYNLPALSPVAMEAVELASQEDIPAPKLARVIERDPSLAARLLKLANSAFFRTSRPAGTLTQAIVKIGFDRVRIMALSISLRDTFPMGKKGPMDYEKFWKLSLYRGLIAKALASRFRSVHPEEAFIAALLEEVGLLMFYDLFIKDRVDDPPLDLDQLDRLLLWEREVYGIDHRDVGKFVLSQWAVPERILMCQEAGVRRSSVETRSEEPLLIVCNVASSLAKVLTTADQDLAAFISKTASEAAVSAEDINRILFSVFEEVEEIGGHLKIQIDHEKDIVALLEKANEALTRISQRLSACAADAPDRLPTIETLIGKSSSSTDVLQAVVHEIRNPLMVVGGFVRKLAQTLSPDSEGSRYVGVILEEASRLERIMGEMNKKLERDRAWLSLLGCFFIICALI
jgi:HD-like signal output (HDOD) protein